VYKLDGQEHFITGTERGRLIYKVDGMVFPVAGKGEWEIRPAQEYATPLGAVDVSYYLQPWIGQPALERDGQIELSYRVEFHAEENAKNLYYICAWEVEGKLVAVGAREFFDAKAKKDPWIFRQMPIQASDRGGRLRAYMFCGGKSLRAVSQRDLDLTGFRAALDQGDLAGASAWLRGPGRDRALPQALLEQVARFGDTGLLDLALAGANAKHAKGRDGANLLLAAAETGRAACVELLLQRKVDPNATGENGSALFRATAAQSPEAVRGLLAAGAKAEYHWGGSLDVPLSNALKSGNAEIARLLMDRGAKLPEKERGQAFTEAVADDHGDLVLLILQLESKPGALLQAVQVHGETPIMLAAYAGAAQSVKALQKAGASLTDEDSAHRTAAAWALKRGEGELAVKLLREEPLTGPAASRLLHDSLLAGNDELVALLVADDATLDVGAVDLGAVLEVVVRTGNVPLLTRALSRGLDADRKYHRDWNLAGMAERYRQTQVTEALENQVGHKVEPSIPKPEKQEVSVSKSGPLMGTLELGPKFNGGEANVDIYIDADGVPHFPMLRSATDERLGRAALVNVLTWRFNPIPGSGSWRRIIFPYDLPAPDTSEKFAQTLFFDGDLPWISSENLPTPSEVGEAGMKEAGWVRFVVSAKGEIVRPRVLGVSTQGIGDQVLAVVKTFHCYPGRQGQVDVDYPMECVVILPGKCVIPANTCVYLGDKSPDDFPTLLLMGDMRTQSQKASGPASKNALVFGLFTVGRSGFPGKLKILGSPSPTLAALAQATYANMTFNALVMDRKQTEYRMVMAAVFRDLNNP